MIYFSSPSTIGWAIRSFIRPIDQQTFFCVYLIACKFLQRKKQQEQVESQINFLSLRFSLSLASWNNFIFHHYLSSPAWATFRSTDPIQIHVETQWRWGAATRMCTFFNINIWIMTRWKRRNKIVNKIVNKIFNYWNRNEWMNGRSWHKKRANKFQIYSNN